MKKNREPLSSRKKISAEKLLNGLTEAQLMTVWDMVEAEFNRLTELDDVIRAREFQVDDQVRWFGKRGEVLIGRVKKINTRTLSVVVTQTRHKWRVPFKMAEKMN